MLSDQMCFKPLACWGCKTANIRQQPKYEFDFEQK